jgi:predicted phage terminase large subunit-like protein
MLGLDRPVRLAECWRFVTVDLAASTKTSADYTVAGVWAITPFGDLVLLDGDRGHIEETAHWGMVRALRERWSADVVYVESRMFGTTLVYEAGRAGVPVQELQADTDKLTRALPAAARADTGRLWLPDVESASWVTDWIDELISFPNGTHDDVVDVVAYAARVVAAHWLPAEEPRRPRAEPDVSQHAWVAATGGRDDFDAMTAQW